MKRRKLLWVLVLVAVVGVLAYVRYGTHDAPSGQRPLAYLDSGSLAMLKADFNRAENQTRIIVLLAPT